MRSVMWLRFPLFVKWYITGRCNLRCKHCYLSDYTRQTPLTRILPVVDYLAERQVRSVYLLGGEPLFRKDLEKITNRLANHKIPTTVVTNGILISPDRAHSLVASGANRFQVSIEGGSAFKNDEIRGKKTFEKAINGVTYLKQAGAQVIIGFTVTKNSIDEIPRLFELSHKLRVDLLRINAFSPVGAGESLSDDYRLDRDSAERISQLIAQCQKKYDNVPVSMPFIRQKNSALEKCKSCTTGCGAGTTTLIINDDLSVAACDLLNQYDRSLEKIRIPSDIDKLWLEHKIFKKWRGLDDGASVGPIKNFSDVHQKNCHVAFHAYKENIFS